MQVREFETLTLEAVDEHVLVVTLDRPEVRNALNTQMGFDLRDLWMELYRDAGSVRCVVLTGRGDKAFCAGGDLKERSTAPPSSAGSRSRSAATSPTPPRPPGSR